MKIYNIISTFFCLVPIIIGFSRFKNLSKSSQYFLYFLVYGFLTDLSVWIFHDSGYLFLSFLIFNLYGLVEAMFFFSFILFIFKLKLVNLICRLALFIMPFLWIFMHVDFESATVIQNTEGTFITVYEVIISILCAMYLLKSAEKQDTHGADFYFIVGIFIYCFCTFFVSALMESPLFSKIWFLHNIINMISYLVFARAFLMHSFKQKQEALQ